MQPDRNETGQLADHFLSAREIAIARFNASLTLAATEVAGLPHTHGAAIAGDGCALLELFPELIGYEDELQAILEYQQGKIEIAFINRPGKKRTEPAYFTLSVLPGGGIGKGLLVVEEVTRMAQLMQSVNQIRNARRLAGRDPMADHLQPIEALLGNSTAINVVRKLIQRVSRVGKSSILLLGESGSGKNLAANILHQSAMPPEAPFVEINCAALPENLLESELFGFERGAFTGAAAARKGLFQEANGGTLFLNEIGEIPPALQAKLLTVLESKSLRRLGSNRLIRVDTRVIAATNRDLQRAVAQKRFRQDLYYRLNVVTIKMPPLRDMADDVLVLADHFIGIFSRDMNKKIVGLTDAARQQLRGYDWPGNARELSNCIERAVIFCDGEKIDAEHLLIGAKTHAAPVLSDPGSLSVPPRGIDLDAVESTLIHSALVQAGGNKAKAARLLGLSRDKLRYRMAKHHLK